MENILIRKVHLNDAEKLRDIGIRTFHETFASQNSEENMRQYLDEKFSIDALTAELSDPDSQFFFAMSGDDVVGYLKLNTGKAQTELKNHSALEIERIYVAKEYHGKKVGQLLYEKALAIARDMNADYLWLGVWEENPRAISFYRKNGFVEFDKHIFKLGDDEQTDIMMKLSLHND